MDLRQKLCAALCAMLFLCALLAAVPAARAEEPAAPANTDVLRLHVIANSDSPGDQAVKRAVRDAVLALVPACESEAEAEAYLLTHGRALLAAAEDTLRAHGYDYGAQLMLGRYPFPTRTYGDTVYPAGEYNALRVMLGRGSGANWWCVLFPPLCIVTEKSEPLPEKDDIEFESSIASWWRNWRNS